jgi:hypothetical protein
LGLSNSIDKAVKAYIDHTQAVLDGDDTLDLSLLIAPFDNLQGAVAIQHAIASTAADDTDGGKKKRKRNYKARDPNAPKRPLTAYFRYLQENRARIAAEMADGKRETGDVGKVLTEMWNAMTPAEHEAYREDYKRECLKYDQAVLDYKAAGGKLDDDTAEEQEDEEQPPAKAKAAPAKKAAAAPSPAAPKTKAAAKPASAKKAAAKPAEADASVAAPTPKSTGKKFSSINRPTESEPKSDAAAPVKTPRKRKAPASKDAAADDAEAPKPKRGRKSKADKDAEAAESKGEKPASTPAADKTADKAADKATDKAADKTADKADSATPAKSEAAKPKKAPSSRKRKSEIVTAA